MMIMMMVMMIMIIMIIIIIIIIRFLLSHSWCGIGEGCCKGWSISIFMRQTDLLIQRQWYKIYVIVLPKW